MNIAETEHYVLVRYVEGNVGADTMTAAVVKMMKFMDELHEQGYRPLHYLPKISGWVCEKPSGRAKERISA